ncbi:hypothetical protein CRI94_16655 [Longibacter salinarum]|uniref:C-methyltransferase domain-containing protein n=1 Tax=Longibacter salinarum TaxID=1850348 RepID=A0A2A8CTR9_9BACT|nr:methyltransferase domain-containing protein [Longibacter salinarum]PEN11212.1 hypothetical protein CRI94_16655 [Longibacter salinarum]
MSSSPSLSADVPKSPFQASDEDPFFSVHDVPVNSVLLVDSEDEARTFPTGDIELVLCKDSGFITNRAFDAESIQYTEKYEETQGFSGTFNAFHRRLAQDVIDRFDLRNKHILEIGCGKGEFLTLLCEMGDNTGIGFDPAYRPERNQHPAAERITFVRDFYSEACDNVDADAVCCKMTLEHIPDVEGFVRMVRNGIGDQSHVPVFFQVPEMRRVLRDVAFWDIYHEHCSYFSPGSLARLFRRAGFTVTDLWTDYDDQYLMIEAYPRLQEERVGASHPLEESPAEIASDVARFARKVKPRIRSWQTLLKEVSREGQRVLIWGGGSKAVAFLTTLGLTDEVAGVVDVNPYKHDHFLPGTAHRVLSPDEVPMLDPDVVLIMNPIYRSEIEQQLTDLGVETDIWHVDEDPSARTLRQQSEPAGMPVVDAHDGSVCPITKTRDTTPVLSIREVPVLCNVLYDSREDAMVAERDDIDLVFSPASGHLFNAAFDSTRIAYSQTYENSLHHSPRFQAFASELARRLVRTYDVRGETVTDIGCGNGEFLTLMCEAGNNRGVGFDPSYDSENVDPAVGRGITIIPDEYRSAYAEIEARLITCRHVLEHISEPLLFMRTIRQASRWHSDTVVYLEVPNADFMLRKGAIWDLIYEHVSYYTPQSIRELARQTGFDVLRMEESFGGQYLSVDLRPAVSGLPPEQPDTDVAGHERVLRNRVDGFSKRYHEKHDRWSKTLSQAAQKGETVVLWGAGSKGVTFLNAVPAARAVPAIVDINPSKQGRFVAGTGQPIVAPEALVELQPDLVVLMNGLYRDEVSDMLDALDLSPHLVTAT